MVVLDAYALIAAFAHEPAGPEVEALLRDPAEQVTVTAVNVAEIIDIMVRVNGNAFTDVSDAIALLTMEGLEVVAVDEATGRAAGQLRSHYYHRQTRALSMADCVCLALARGLGARLATADSALAATAREVGVEVVALLDSAGRRP